MSHTATPATTAPDDEQANEQDLLAKARSFLASPQVQSQDTPAKRRFLAEKGLTDTQIARLLLEQVCLTLMSQSLRANIPL
jgi:hypothetical protein